MDIVQRMLGRPRPQNSQEASDWRRFYRMIERVTRPSLSRAGRRALLIRGEVARVLKKRPIR